jgi:hypothetical protein
MLCGSVRDNLINHLSENFSDVHCPGGFLSSSSSDRSIWLTHVHAAVVL